MNAPTPPLAPDTRTDAPLAGARLLVVEDDAPSRELLLRRLARDGAQAQGAADGPSALALLAGETFDAVLLDIGLPGMDGLQVLHAIRRDHGPETLPVLMVTAFSEQERLVEAMEAGANDYLNKPIDYRLVRARLRARMELARSARELQRLRQRQALVLRASNDGIWELDATTGQIEHSPSWNRLLGLAPEAAPQNVAGWLARIHPADAQTTREQFEAFLADPVQDAFRLQYRMRRGDGDFTWIETRGAALRDDHGRCLRLAGTHSDIGALRYVNAATGLPNLLRLTDHIAVWREQHPGAEHALLQLDLRNLDAQTDARSGLTLGRVVFTLAESLRPLLEPGDLIANGTLSNLLMVFLPRAIDPAEQYRLARRLLQRLKSGSETPGGQRLTAHAHAGLWHSRDAAAAPPEEAAAAVNAATLAAHERGLDVLRFTAELQAQEDMRRRLSAELHAAVAEEQIEPWWQPILYADGRLAGFEALARWQRADGSRISPAVFVPLATRAGLLPEMTAQVLDKSLAALARWRDAGWVDTDAYMSVNFSSQSLADPAFALTLMAAVASHELPPEALCVEVTESDAADPDANLLQIVSDLHERGLRVALDDFGTGYSSLSQLNRQAFDTIKIDQSFVRNMLDQPRLLEMIRAMVAMARALGLKLVAEGVETTAHEQALCAEGVDRLQGFLYARAMPEAELIDWLRQRATSFAAARARLPAGLGQDFGAGTDT